MKIGKNTYQGKIKIDGKVIKSYQIWRTMMQRCYDETTQNKKENVKYKGCEVCDEWHDYKNFKEWYDKNYRWELEEIGIKLALDKDLLSGESKIYSPKTCMFIPEEINSFMTNKKSNNKSGYTGVSWATREGKWRAQINEFDTKKYKHLGYFTDIQIASKVYLKAREIESEKAREFMRELCYDDEIIKNII